MLKGKKSETVKNLIDALKNGILVQDEFQRPAGKWNRTQKTKLLETVFKPTGYGVISPIILCQFQDGSVTCLDGQQRLNTLKEFYEGGAICLNPATVKSLKSEGFSVRASKQNFETLPDGLKKRFNDFSIPIEWLSQRDDEDDLSYRDRRHYRFETVNNGTKCSPTDLAHVKAIKEEKFKVQQELRKFQYLEADGESASPLTGNVPVFFTKESQGTDYFSWSAFYGIVWIIQATSRGIIPNCPKHKLISGDNWKIPRTASWYKIITDNTKSWDSRAYEEFKQNIARAKDVLLSQGDSMKKVSSATYEQKQTSWENLRLCFSKSLGMCLDDLPLHPSKEEIDEIAEEQKRSGGADIKFLSVKMSEYLSEKFPVPDKTRS